MEKRAILDPIKALHIASEALDFPISGGVTADSSKKVDSVTIQGTSGAREDPEAKLVYFIRSDGDLALAWRVETRVTEQWLVSYVDAEETSDPEILGVVDYISHATYEV